MSTELERATEQMQAGQYKKAVDTLWGVTFAGDDGELQAQRVIALATQLRDATEGGLRHDCEEHIARAQRFLSPEGATELQAHAEGRAEKLAQEQREEAVRLAREARAAGLAWLEIRSGREQVAGELRAASSVGAAATSTLIEAVEAEGWRLEHMSAFFRPTKVQTSPLRGADFFMGGDVVDGQEVRLYLFRRADDRTR